ncbi:competence protein ComEA [Dysgonomonadaceae bacterium PH5-43]|nr:competence protein ComEA [Dysgonomonadaceae bacterium PH5-43]
MWRDFFYFSKRERQGILILIIFLAGILLGKYIFKPKGDKTLIVETHNETEIQNPETLIVQQTPIKTQSYTHTKPKTQEKKTYYVQQKDTTYKFAPSNYTKIEKLKEGQTIEINTADTTDLKKIPGIGSSFAKRIVGYRQLLGGYHSHKQLQEIYGMYEELYEKIIPFIDIDDDKITKINVNTLSLDKLKSHPYINFYKAKAIVELRNKTSKLESINDLILLEEFPEEDLKKLMPYLSFN